MNYLVLAAGGLTSVQPGLIFWTIVTFVLVALVLRAKAWKPVLQLVEERERQIHDALDKAKREREDAEKLLAEQRAAIAEARREAAETVRRTQADMERFREDLMAKSRREAEELKLEAKRTIEAERAKAVAEVKTHAVGLAIQIAEKLLAEKLDDARHRQLAEDFIAQLPAVNGGARATGWRPGTRGALDRNRRAAERRQVHPVQRAVVGRGAGRELSLLHH